MKETTVFTAEEFFHSNELFKVIREDNVSKESFFSTKLQSTYFTDLKKRSLHEFLSELVHCYRGIVFTDNEKLRKIFLDLLDSPDAGRWFIPFTEVSDQFDKLSESVNGQLLRGYLLHHILDYLEVKIAIEILKWGDFTEEHRGVEDVPKPVKTVDNIYRRMKDASGEAISPRNEFEIRMIDVVSNYIDKTDDSENSKKFLFKGLRGNVEKVYAILIERGIKRPTTMSTRQFHCSLFDLYYLIFKNIGWMSMPMFEEEIMEKQKKIKKSYTLADPEKNYNSYKIRQVKSLLLPDSILAAT